MNKNIEFTMLIAFADGVDPLSRYGDYKSGVTTLLSATSVITRHFTLDPKFGGGKTATIISKVVVDNALDFNDHFEAFRAAVATGFGVGEFDVSVLTSEESVIPE